MQYTLIISTWMLYFFLHSLLADLQVKEILYQRFPFLEKYYRLFYTSFSTFTLVIIIYCHFSLPKDFVFSTPLWLRYLTYFLSGLGAFILFLAFKNYDSQEFIGLKQMQIAKEEYTNLQIKGLNAWMRHPIYLGALLIFVSLFLYQATFLNLWLLLIVICYLIVGIILEERKLIKAFGEDYKIYQKKVKVLIPFIL